MSTSAWVTISRGDSPRLPDLLVALGHVASDLLAFLPTTRPADIIPGIQQAYSYFPKPSDIPWDLHLWVNFHAHSVGLCFSSGSCTGGWVLTAS